MTTESPQSSTEPLGRKHVVYVTQPVHPDAFAFLCEQAEVHVGFGPDAEPIEQVLPEIEGLLVRHKGIAGDVILRAPALRVIARPGSGFENIGVDAARERKIPALVTLGANSTAVAEHVFALALAVLRSIPKWDRITRSGGPGLRELREQDPANDLSGKRLGIIGIGRIGGEVARIGRDGFRMEVLAYHPSRSGDEIRARGAEPTSSLLELLAESDVVSLQVPLTPGTKGMLGREEFRAMRRNAVLINVARGGIVDEQALVEALQDGELAGAGIDVYDGMVPPADHPLLKLEQVVLTPHRAGRTEGAQRRMGMDAVQALLDTLDGKRPTQVIDVASAQ